MRFTRANILFIFLGAFFIANAIIAEFIGVKIFSLEASMGFEPLKFVILGEELNLNLTAGVLLWPVVFIMTDIINEYYGQKGVRLLSYIAAALIIYGFAVIRWAIALEPAEFWVTSHLFVYEGVELESMKGEVSNFNTAYGLVFGQGTWIIIGSLCAFLIGQLIDVLVFQRIKRFTGEKMLWLRATGSTLISQLFDSFIVLFIAFYLGADWPLSLVLAVGALNYTYKICGCYCDDTVTVLGTPCHRSLLPRIGYGKSLKKTGDRIKKRQEQSSLP